MTSVLVNCALCPKTQGFEEDLYSFIYNKHQMQIFIKYLLCARHCAGDRDTMVRKRLFLGRGTVIGQRLSQINITLQTMVSAVEKRPRPAQNV